jgi:tRNA pseudouridine55 synthase
MDGVLIVDKPPKITSHDVVSRCRCILKTKRIGHTGTLDPFATGVMVILVGRATRLAQFLDKDAKEYEAEICFGFETDTGDLTGQPKTDFQSFAPFTEVEIEKALQDFRGEIWQIPPMFSAKKIEGKKLYEIARKGLEIRRNPVKVVVHDLRLTSLDKNEVTNCRQRATIRILCSAGTYIRVLAEDIGRKLGVGAHLTALRRTKSGKFTIEQAFSLEDLEQVSKTEETEKFLIPMNEAILHLPKIVLDKTRVEKTKNGLSSRCENNALKEGQPVRMLDENRNLIAVGYFDKTKKVVQPKIVLV